MPSGVTGFHLLHAIELLVHRFQTPEASAAQRCRFSRHDSLAFFLPLVLSL
jgi:hypothetical protein